MTIASPAPTPNFEEHLRIASTEIAKRTKKQHKHVIRDIEVMLRELIGPDLDPSTIGCERGTYRDSLNRQQTCYYLDRRHAECLATGYDANRRMAIIDFFLAQTPQSRPAIPQTYSEALRLAADEHEKRLQLEAKVENDRPKVEFHDAVTAGDTLCQLAVACQVIDGLPGRNRLFASLRETGVLIQGGERHNHPKQRYIEQGLFVVKESRWENPKRSGITFTPYLTQKGLKWLQQNYAEKKSA